MSELETPSDIFRRWFGKEMRKQIDSQVSLWKRFENARIEQFNKRKLNHHKLGAFYV